MPYTLDSAAVRKWWSLALTELRRERDGIDTINVFPIADGDTGSNMCLTAAAAARALAEAGDAGGAGDALRAASRGALLGACGNSGTILAQLLCGMAEVYASPPEDGAHDTDTDAREAINACANAAAPAGVPRIPSSAGNTPR